MTKKIEKYYSTREAGQYEVNRDDIVWRSENIVFVELLNSAAKKLKKDLLTIFDMPCGTGRWIPFIDPYVKKYVGVDVSVSMLLEAKKKTNTLELSRVPFYEFVESSYQGLSRDGKDKYDLVICTRFLPHFDIKEVEEILKVLNEKTDGYAIVMVRVAEAPWQLISENINFIFSSPTRAFKRWKKSGRISNTKLRSVYEVAFTKAGLSIIEQKCVHSYRNSRFEYWLVC